MDTNQTIAANIARQLREAYFGKNWTWVDLKETLSDVDWQEATKQVDGFNSIVKLVYHIHYYLDRQVLVLEGKSLDGHDKDSFNHPPVHAAADWQKLLERVNTTAERWASLVEKMPDSKLSEPFDSGKYGNWYRNLCGAIEHVYYHLGQIVWMKKILRKQ